MIGGYAVGIYGYSRSTNDLDVVVSNEPANVSKLVQALSDFGFPILDLEQSFAKDRSIVEIRAEPMRIEILNFANGIDFEAAFAARNDIEIEGISVNVISKSDLIKNKKASGRFKDLADVERLEKM